MGSTSRAARSACRCAPGPGVLAEAVRRLDEAGVELEDLEVHRPTLDDVFLSLTGHAAEEAAEGEQAEAEAS